MLYKVQRKGGGRRLGLGNTFKVRNFSFYSTALNYDRFGWVRFIRFLPCKTGTEPDRTIFLNFIIGLIGFFFRFGFFGFFSRFSRLNRFFGSVCSPLVSGIIQEFLFIINSTVLGHASFHGT